MLDGGLGAAVSDLVEGAHVADIELTAAVDRVPLLPHLLRTFGADHPHAADVGLEEFVELWKRGLVPLHEGIDGGIEQLAMAACLYSTR